MGLFRFRRSFRTAPGLRLNFGKRNASVSIGVRGAHVTFGEGGIRTTVGVPGTGLSYTDVTPHRHHTTESAPRDTPPNGEPTPAGRSSRGWLWILFLIAAIVAIVFGVAH
jgi:hypothetical protein